MIIFKKVSSILPLALILMLVYSPVQAQRGISYNQLVNQQRDQNIYIDNFTLPGTQPGTVQFVTTFRIDYTLLPFKKTPNNFGDSRQNFFSPVGMNIEIFKNPNARSSNNRRASEFSVEGLEPVSRGAWKDTAYAENYEQTKSKNQFISGQLASNLEPGQYSYILQFIRSEEVNGSQSRRRSAIIKPYDTKNKGHVILADGYTQPGSGNTQPTVDLLNFGDNVYYGKDFHAFIHLPSHQSSDTYNFQVDRVNITENDTTRVSSVHSGSIKPDQILQNMRPELVTGASSPRLQLNENSNGEAYAVVKIPNSQFMNAVYQFSVTKEGQQAPVAQTIFRSRWIDMPTSLLSVDVAIEMLRFIVDEQTIRNMLNGSNAEKEKKLRAFWEKRDPTPKTEFNELMAEYYRRIDYAYESFSTVEVLGFNTDQGSIYIKYGPPQNINRKFPPGEPAVEVWEYPDRNFVFRAVSGFGQFKLVSGQQ